MCILTPLTSLCSNLVQSPIFLKGQSPSKHNRKAHQNPIMTSAGRFPGLMETPAQLGHLSKSWPKTQTLGP